MLHAGSIGKLVLKNSFRWAKKARVHQMLGVIIVTAHASEIIRVVSHIKLWHLFAAALLFIIWLATEKDHSDHNSELV